MHLVKTCDESIFQPYEQTSSFDKTYLKPMIGLWPQNLDELNEDPLNFRFLQCALPVYLWLYPK